MIYDRVALKGSQSATWRWKSSPVTSLHGVLGLVKLYHCVPNEHIRVFLSSSPEQMDEMLSRANQGLPSTAFSLDQLWDRHSMSWIEVRRLEGGVGAGGGHDRAYSLRLAASGAQHLGWTKRQFLRERGEFE